MNTNNAVEPTAIPIRQYPTSPNDMPFGLLSSNLHWLRNIIVTLHEHSVVDIHWERDWETERVTGEPAGEWNVLIETANNKRIMCKHGDLESALWFVNEVAEIANNEAYQAYEKKRNDALSKLTIEEQKMLRLR